MLTPIYLFTLLAHAVIVTLLVFHEIEIHAPFHRSDNITNIVAIIGSYGVLWLNFLLDCLIISCWLSLFADLFGFVANAQACCLFRYGIKKLIRSLLISSIIYLIIVVTFAILINR